MSPDTVCPVLDASPAPVELTALERLLVTRTRDAISRGRELRQWWLREGPSLQGFPLTVKSNLANEAWGYLSSAVIAGEKLTAMACRQHIRYGRVDRPDAAELLREFVLREFLTRAHWDNPNGFPGGFTVTRLLYCTLDGRVGRYDATTNEGGMDWRELGTTLSWVLLQVGINDFTVNFGPVHRPMKAAALVAPESDFVEIRYNPRPDCVLAVTVGYPFVEYAPIPNKMGYGPGKFGTAIKMFRFELSNTNDVSVEMAFVSAPRSRKVFDFGPGVPCPIYGTANLLSKLTFGKFKTDGVHDTMDRAMLTEHVNVHQKLMEGLLPIWRTWLAAQAPAR